MVGIHHVEIWVADLQSEVSEWGWLLNRLGYTMTSRWEEGQSWEDGGSYLTLTTSPNLSAADHDRRRPGINHIAFSVDRAVDVDSIMDDAPENGWTSLYHDRYPHAGGNEHYAGWLENGAGFKAEVVWADNSSDQPEIVCICGSARFADDIRAVSRAATLAGAIVLAPAEMQSPITDAQKAALSEIHLAKIDLSDRVVVVNRGGYIGNSVRNEIDYARAGGKPVTFTHLA